MYTVMMHRFMSAVHEQVIRLLLVDAHSNWHNKRAKLIFIYVIFGVKGESSNPVWWMDTFVFLSVCLLPNTSFIRWNQGAIKIALCGFRWKCFVQNFWQPPLPYLTFDRQTDSYGFFSRWLVCRSSDRSYNLTDWSLIIVNCQLCFLTLTVLS